MKHIKGFDGLRAVSIVLVILAHAGTWDRFQHSEAFLRNFDLFTGVLGVKIFFCLSGFLITYLLLNEQQQKGQINFKFFFIRRFLRLTPPLLIFYAAIVVLMSIGALKRDFIAIGISFFYLYNFVPRRFYTPELGHTWSLAVEEQFYLIWPFVLSAIRRLQKRIIIILSCLSLCLIWSLSYDFCFTFKGQEDHLSHYFFVERWFLPACLPIMFGALAALLLFHKNDWLVGLIKNSWWWPVLCMLFFPLQHLLNLPEWLPFLGIPILCSILLLWVFLHQESFLVRLLEFRPLAFIGKISYGLYVYQGLFLRTGIGGKLSIQQAPLNLVLTVTIALISYFFIERRVLRYKATFSVG